MIPISNTTLDNNSIFRKINPAFKFIVFILSVFMFFTPSGFFGQIFLVVITIISLILAKLSKKTYLNLFKTFIIMLAMFILINWFTVKFPTFIWLDSSNYLGIGSFNNAFCLNAGDFGYSRPEAQFTGILGDGKILNLDEVKNNITQLANTDMKQINKWISSLDSNTRDAILNYIKIQNPSQSEDWCKALLYGLNNEYTINGITYKYDIAQNLTSASSLEALNTGLKYSGLVYDMQGVVTYVSKWYSIGPEAFTRALSVSVKVTMIIATSIILTATTSPAELTNGIEKLFSPLKIIKFPANECALILAIGIRFIPSLLIESRRILNAQASRGLDFYNGNLWIKIRSLVSLIIPLFSISINRSAELANAMEARGFNPRADRTKYHEIHTHWIDFIYIFLLFFAMALQMFLWAFNILLLPFGIIEAGMVL